MNLQEKLISILYKTSSANYASELLTKECEEHAINFTNYVFDNYVKFGDYYHLKGEVYWNTTRKDLKELLEEFHSEND